MRTDPYKAYILQFPKRSHSELKQKIAYKDFLLKRAGFHVPERVWYSFLTPANTVQRHTAAKEKQKIWALKKSVLSSFAHPERFFKISPSNRHSTEIVTAALIEILFDLEMRKVLLSKEPYKQWVDIAERFGLWKLRYYFEDAIFKNFDPVNYKIFRSVVQKKMRTDADFIADVKEILGHAFQKARISGFEILNRQKNVYGVYDKMHKKGKNINDVYDIHGFRILTKTKQDCYRVHDAVDRLWPTYRDRYKDYIKNPKKNGYQSIHTVLRCLKDTPIEFQIRSFEMDVVAQSGPANHMDYKKQS